MPPITTGRFLKKDDCSEEGELHTITEVVEENVAPEDKNEDIKWVMHFEDAKPLILNATNINRCTQAFGTNQSEAWAGKQIIVYADPDIEFGGKIVGGVRLRAVKGQKAAKGKAVAPADTDRVPF